VVATAPGRINLIGEHTDYCAGLALPAAIDRWMVVALAPRTDGQVRVRAADLDASATWTLGSAAPKAPGWACMAAGAVAETQAAGTQVPGFDAWVRGTVPLGSGLSSSAALSLAWLAALAALTGLAEAPLARARRAQAIENHWLGVRTGLLDPLAILLARPGELVRLDFASLEWTRHPTTLTDWRWVAVHSGVSRTLADSAYDTRVAECKAGLVALRGPEAPIQALRSVQREELDAGAIWGRRLHHVIRENQRVDQTVDALAVGDAHTIGQLLLASHESLRVSFEVSCPALDRLVERAQALPGCVGARMMGGGFGGCTLNLVHRDAVPSFIAVMARDPDRRGKAEHRALALRVVGGPMVQRPEM